MNQLPFSCDLPDCSGTVDMRTGPGRRHEMRAGVYCDIPDDMPFAECDACGEMYLTSAEAEALERYWQRIEARRQQLESNLDFFVDTVDA